jgi:hypothetical protein
MDIDIDIVYAQSFEETEVLPTKEKHLCSRHQVEIGPTTLCHDQ